MRHATPLAAAFAVVLLAPAFDVHALDILRQHYRSAVGACQGALPSFEGALRKRPLAIANEGSSTSFVSCSLDSDANGGREQFQVVVGLANRGATTATVSCTLVDGLANLVTPAYYPKSVSIGSNGPATLTWTSDDDPDDQGFNAPGLNCSLPAGVEITWINNEYPEYVGNN